ncbi:MAG: 16S rRNA (guanine(527)-N(7))-methyltransferase RsmG [Candidatus Cloacimonetes bacterium]|nr:16S rRNA (guanine(527)-N(7))-methyltransferase RsmG [Candidatus Cloacimonadota bacterium]
MIEQKKRFEEYLKEIGLTDIPQLMGKFEHYFQLLNITNRQVNLVSRNTPQVKYWIQHFLDSLLALECLELADKTVLDFGSGGGIPGIPLKLAVPECTMVLLDSVQKKTHSMQEFVEALGLSDTSVVCSRLEDYAFTPRRPSFDIIVCRAVALEERYLAPLRRLLKPSGMAVFYKAQKLADLEGLKYQILLERTDTDLGQRKIIGIKQRDLMKH